MNLPKIKNNKKHFLVISLVIAVLLCGIIQQRQLNVIKKEKEETEQQSRKTQRKNESLMDEIFDKNNQLEKQEGELNKLKESEKILNKKNSDLQEQLKKKDTEINQLNDKIKKMSSKPEQAVAQSDNSKNNNQEEWMTFEATYYDAFCNTGCTGKTALGWNVSNTVYHQGHRVVAVDPNVISLGSLLEIKTPYKSFTALAGDTGGDIKNHRIDILVESKSKAYKLGRHNVKVRVIKEG
ncbi:3D domain-containing protein [Siminovitchia sp. 179-K 8D1 HS]|uniref:3D domain-containing protein n=1 Tax=Siminovitchia sp. 179-K 8D1 HS TaxID=3142385 RepID=UPI00399F1166